MTAADDSNGTIEERKQILRVALSELSIHGKSSGRVYKSASAGAAFLLADRLDVRCGVIQELKKIEESVGKSAPQNIRTPYH